jgi:hypothetical protein
MADFPADAKNRFVGAIQNFADNLLYWLIIGLERTLVNFYRQEGARARKN